MLVISSTFTANPVKKPMLWFLGRFSFFNEYQIEFTPYNQVFQELETSNSLMVRNVGGINVLIIKLDDFLRFQKSTLTYNEAAVIIKRESLRLIADLTSRARTMDSTSFILVVCHSVPSAVDADSYSRLYDYITKSFKTELSKISNIHFIFEQDISRFVAVDNYYDSIADKNGHIPFVYDYYNALGYLLARKIFAVSILAHKPLKAIILDCDNTLWKGVCGEVGAEQIEITPAHLFLQQFMKKQKECGVLLCLCSKNNEKDVLDVFNCDKNGMLLKLEDIAAYKINWNAKSHNIRELLEFLEFDEQSVVFIDDRKDECIEVQKEFPRLCTVQLPEEKDVESFLENLWIFDHGRSFTNEDKNRTKVYQKKFFSSKYAAFDDKQSLCPINSETIIDFIELSLDNTKDSIIQRVSDLTSRTNQFNLAKKIYPEAKITTFLKNSEYRILLADVKDNNGNEYGLTGLVIFKISNKSLYIDTFLLSCRIIGKGVERVMLDKIFDIAKKNNLASLIIPFIPSERNKPAESFLKSIANINETTIPAEFIDESSYKSLQLYSLNISSCSSIDYQDHCYAFINLPKISETIISDSDYPAVIDIAKNYRKYLSGSAYRVTAEANDDLAANLLEMLNIICGKKVHSIDANFTSGGVDSFELMMFLAKIYRELKVKIDLSEMQELNNIGALTEVVKQRIGTVVEDAVCNDGVSSGLISLSSAQEALWLERLKMQSDVAYNLFRTFRLNGALDYSRLEKAFQVVIKKHESLRTAFLVQNDSVLPICKVFEPSAIDFKLQLEKIAFFEINNISEVVHLLAGRAFSLEVPPIMRVHLITTAPNENYLLIVMHHMICDGWSFSRIVNEVVRVYNDDHDEFSKKTNGVLPYSMFIKWQQKKMAVIGDANSTLFKKHFINYPVMNLPYDFNKKKVSSYKGEHISFELDCETTNKLHQIASTCKATLYEVMLSIYAIYLAKLCDQTSVSLASVITTRPQEYFDTIGYMANLITLRFDVSSNPEFLDFLKKTRLYFRKIRKLGDMPFLDVVKRYHDCFDDVGILTRTLFVFENFPSYELSLNSIRAQEVYYGNYLTLSLPNMSKFDLALYFREKGGGINRRLCGVAEFSTDSFKPETIAVFVDQFKQLIGSVIDNIDEPILSYSILTKKEKNVLVAWNNGYKKKYAQKQTVIDLFLCQVNNNPQKAALIEENGEKVTYDELNAKSNQYASYLKDLGITKGDVVAVSLERSIEMITWLLAIARLGGIYLAIDPTNPSERRKYLCKDSGAKLYIDQSLKPQQVDNINNIDGEHINAEDVFYIVYTSGSTGKPKGVPTTHLAFCNLLYWSKEYFGLSTDTNTALATGESFDAFSWQVWSYLVSGATIYIVSKTTLLDMEKFVELLNDKQISICLVPTVYTEILISDEYLDKIKSLKYLLTGGDEIKCFLPKPYPFKVMNIYGVAESTVVSVVGEIPFVEKSILEKLPYSNPLIGQPISNTKIYIVDSGKKLVPIKVWGELCIGGIGVSSGYINDKSLSANKFVRNGFDSETDSNSIVYFTGDKARFLEDGSIEYGGRLDYQIEIDGYRVEPMEIETIILQDVRVNQAVVVLHSNEQTKQLIAYITLKNKADNSFNAINLIEEFKKHLPAKMVPTNVVIMDILPITENGKIDRKCLMKMPVPEQKDVLISMEDKLAKDVLSIFSKLLNVPCDKINIDKPFFDLGGDSIGILKLLNTIKREFGISIPISEVYANDSSVSALVCKIAQYQQKNQIIGNHDVKLINNSDISNRVVTLRSGDNKKTPIFFMHLAGGTVFCYQALIDSLDEGRTCYGIQYPLDNQHECNLPASIQELASFYVNTILAIQPNGPYAIAGHSFGGMLSYEIAYQLFNAGKKIGFIGILDSWVVSVLDFKKRQKLKRSIIENYENKYESAFMENPIAETIFIHMQNIGFIYKPPLFANKIELFKAEQLAPELLGIEDNTDFWSNFTKVNVHSVPGDHNSMLDKDNIKVLADKFTKVLSFIDSEG